MDEHADGSLDAVFRYDGTTCTNMGRPLAFHYGVKLGPRAEGYPIRSSIARRRRATTGTRTCAEYIDDPEGADGRDRTREAAARGATGRSACRGAGSRAGRDVIASQQAAITNGGWFSKPFTMLWRGKSRRRKRKDDEEAFAGCNSGAAPAGRRRHGHAADARRAGAGQLRRGVESDASGAGAGASSAAMWRPARIASSRIHLAARASCSRAMARRITLWRSTKPAWQIAREAFGERRRLCASATSDRLAA